MINVMYATDDNYAEIMGVSIKSLLENNPEEDMTFYIVEDQVTKSNLDKLWTMIEETGNFVTFIPKPNIRERLGVNLRTLRWSDSAYSRLFLKELFIGRPEVEKILYLDCDTLIVGKIRPLWESDIEGYLGAACLECMSNMHKRIIGAKKTDNYVNTGMILFNVKRWIEEDIETIAVNFIRKYKGKTEYVDQGVINGTISNRLKLVSPRYNLTCPAFNFTYDEMHIYLKPEFGYSRSEWEDAMKAPVLVHFTASFLSVRPWFEGSKHPYARYWKDMHGKTPWRYEPWRILINREERDMKERIYRILPGKMGLHIVGFLHSYIKPIIYVLK